MKKDKNQLLVWIWVKNVGDNAYWLIPQKQRGGSKEIEFIINMG